MDGDPSPGHPPPGDISFDHGTSDDDDCPPLQARCASDSSSDERMSWLFPQAPPTKSTPFDMASFNCSEIPDKTEIEQHRQQLQCMLHALSTRGMIPPSTGPSSQR
mmetsp:Transcript_8957/g.13269  ORF Transcript_8957/g.13269 Transcript_8957/m.13269 type:complete len:106 (+) Transcript_8957:51-368(+)